MRETIRTCRTIRECGRCRRYITFGERYKDGGKQRRVHVKCKRSKIWRQLPVEGIGIPRIVDILRSIPLGAEGLEGSANVFTHTPGVGPRYRLVLNSKGVEPSDVGLDDDNSLRQMNSGYGYAVHFRLPNFTYMGDAFGFRTPQKAADEAVRQFNGVFRLFRKFNEKKIRRRVARTGKLAFFPGVEA